MAQKRSLPSGSDLRQYRANGLAIGFNQRTEAFVNPAVPGDTLWDYSSVVYSIDESGV